MGAATASPATFSFLTFLTPSFPSGLPLSTFFFSTTSTTFSSTLIGVASAATTGFLGTLTSGLISTNGTLSVSIETNEGWKMVDLAKTVET